MANMNFFKSKEDKKELTDTWKVLIADDEIDIHTLTKTVLKNYTYKEKVLEFLSAYSGEEAINILKEHDDVFLVFLDVIMETDDAGLVAVKRIRNELKNSNIQIILRTGQAANVPENDVVMEYAINDYKEKTELTSKKLITSVTTAIRSYENILLVDKNQRKVLELNYDLNQTISSFDNSVIASRVNKNKEITYVSKAFCQRFGYTREELLGETHDILRHPDLDKDILESLSTSYNKHSDWEGELMYLTKDKETFWAYVKRSAEYNNEGEFLSYVNIFFDITYQKKVETINYELTNLISSFDQNVIASKTDNNGDIIYVSRAFCDISKYSKEELFSKNHNVIKGIDTSSTLYETLWSTITSGKVWKGELENINKDGVHYWLSTIITPEYDIQGKFLCYTSISQDITHQKAVQDAKIEIEQLNIEIKDTQKEVVFRMGAIAEARSKETGAHVKRVAEYSKLLAIHLGINEYEAEVLKQASPMHDIGKVAIPDIILNKPGKLTVEEFEIMKTHARIGYDMLKNSDRDILKVAAVVAHEHHEKYDGSGYPKALKGEDIHIYGRITAFADVFDALGSDRCYKKSWEDERIFKMFKEESGKHFDPKIVDIFFDNLDDFYAIRDTFRDDLY